LIVAVLLVAGCVGWLGGTYKQDQNVLITKLNPEGLTVWTRLIDTGKYDYALDFIETTDGGFIVVGGMSRIVCGYFHPPSPDTPRLTRLSSTGKVLWERDYDKRINAVVQNRDGSFSAVTDHGVILDLDANGVVKNEHNPEIRRIGSDEWERIDTFAALKNGGFLLAGQTIAKIDQKGNLSWQLLNETTFHNAFSIAEMKNQRGYLVLIYSESRGHAIIQLDLNGSIVRTTPSGNFDENSKPVIQQTDDGYSILSKNIWSPEYSSYSDQNCVAVHLDNEGKKINITNLTDAVSVRTACDGRSIATSDGGYAVMSPIEKQYPCSEISQD